MSASTSRDHEPSHAPASASAAPATLVWAPLLVALVALAGSLWLSIGTAPHQSLAVLIVLLVLVAVGVSRSRNVGESHPVVVGAAVVLGLLLAWGAVASSPPMPPIPKQAYTAPLDICRPPFPQ